MTIADGSYLISQIIPGTWKVKEVQQNGWTQSYPANGYYEETFISGASLTENNFGNWQPATKSGFKFLDKDMDGEWDDNEYGLEGWVIFIDLNNNSTKDVREPWTIIDSDGYYEFTNLEPGEYYFREVLQEHWYNTFPANGYWHEILASGDDSENNNFGNVYYHDETAWALWNPANEGENENWDYVPKSKNWGWHLGPFSPDQNISYQYELWAAAGQNKTANGFLVGNVEVQVDTDDDTVTVFYNLFNEYDLMETHLWIGNTRLPMVQQGKKMVMTDAPGQMTFISEVTYSFTDLGIGEENSIYIAAHAVIRSYEPMD